MVKEKLSKIQNYENYMVSDFGNVFNLKRKTKLKTSLTTNGYLKVRLYNDGKGKTFTVHSLVANSFLKPKNDLVVNHIDYDKTNNNLSNIELVSQRENVKHGRANKNYSSNKLGVSWFKRNNKWGASIFVNGKNKFLGLFAKEEDAKLAYDNYLLTLN